MPKDKRRQDMLDDVAVSDHVPYGEQCEKDNDTGRVTCVGKILLGRGDSRHVEEGGVVFDRVQGRPQLIEEFGSQHVKERLRRNIQKRLR